jgi:hypothetical protein
MFTPNAGRADEGLPEPILTADELVARLEVR